VTRRPHPIAGLADGLLNSTVALLGVVWATVEWATHELADAVRFSVEIWRGKCRK
jgi:hypothetical protein